MLGSRLAESLWKDLGLASLDQSLNYSLRWGQIGQLIDIDGDVKEGEGVGEYVYRELCD